MTKNINVDKPTFKIMELNDFHNSLLLSIWNNKTFKKLDKIIENENPDLVVLNGDIVWSLFNAHELRIICDFFENRQIYFAYLFGNHDVQFGKSETRLAEVFKDYEYSLFDIGYTDLDRIGNYFITISQNSNIKFSICCMNSGIGYLSQKQVDFYEYTIKDINEKANETIPNIYFQHIPLKQVQFGVDNNTQNGRVVEDVSEMVEQKNLFEKMKELNSTKYVYSGHDHPNDFDLTYDGIYFKSCRGSGYSGYTRGNEDRGATIIELDLTNKTLTDRTIKYSSI